jgi:hypothetical protein
MYTVLSKSQYKKMTLKQRVAEFKKYFEDMFSDSVKESAKESAFCTREWGDVDEVLEASFEDLPTMINEFTGETIAGKLLNLRLENNVEVCEDTFLYSDEVGKIVAQELRETEDEEDNYRRNCDIRDRIDYLKNICAIFNFEDISKSLDVWRP